MQFCNLQTWVTYLIETGPGNPSERDFEDRFYMRNGDRFYYGNSWWRRRAYYVATEPVDYEISHYDEYDFEAGEAFNVDCLEYTGRGHCQLMVDGLVKGEGGTPDSALQVVDAMRRNPLACQQQIPACPDVQRYPNTRIEARRYPWCDDRR